MPKNSMIAIVDDDAVVRESLGGLLRSHGYRTALFASAEDYLRSTHLMCGNCVICDLHMPGGMDGLALARHMGDYAGSMILITGFMRGDLPIVARALGVAHVLRKPFDVDLMLACVEHILSRRGDCCAPI